MQSALLLQNETIRKVFIGWSRKGVSSFEINKKKKNQIIANFCTRHGKCKPQSLPWQSLKLNTVLKVIYSSIHHKNKTFLLKDY